MSGSKTSWKRVCGVCVASGLILLGCSFYAWGMEKLTNSPAQQHKRLAVEALVAQDFEAAVTEYKKASELDPKDAVIHYELGMAYKDWGKTTDAIDAWSRALRINPGFYQASEALRSIGTTEIAAPVTSSLLTPEKSAAIRALSWESLYGHP